MLLATSEIILPGGTGCVCTCVCTWDVSRHLRVWRRGGVWCVAPLLRSLPCPALCVLVLLTLEDRLRGNPIPGRSPIPEQVGMRPNMFLPLGAQQLVVVGGLLQLCCMRGCVDRIGRTQPTSYRSVLWTCSLGEIGVLLEGLKVWPGKEWRGVRIIL